MSLKAIIWKTGGFRRGLRGLVLILLAIPAVAAYSADIEAEEAVKESIDGWARAWSDLDIEAYLGYYSVDFEPPEGSREDWEKNRRKRFKKSTSVSIKIDDLQIFAKKRKAYVNFEQVYKSATYADRVLKTLVLIKTDDGWKITHELTRD